MDRIGENSEERLLGTGADTETGVSEIEEKNEDGSEEYYELPPAIRSRTLIWSVASLVLGILSLLLCPFYYVSLVLAALAVGCTVVSRKNLGFFDKLAVLGIILGIMGFVFGIFSLTADMIGLFK